MTKEKRKLKPNLFDALILLVFVGVVIFAFLYFASDSVSGDEKDVYFTVEFRNMDKAFADNISIGDEIKDSVKGYYLGKVDTVEVKQQTEVLFDLNKNEFISTDLEGRYFIYVTVKANGTETDAEIKAEDVVVRLGKQMSLKGKGYAQSGYCVGVSTKERGAAK